jgi:hypothetical protein
MLGSAERQAAAGGEVEETGVAVHLGEDGRETAAAEPFLEDPEGIPGAPDRNHDETPRIKTEAAEAHTVKLAGFPGGSSFGDPEDRAVVGRGQTRQDSGREAGYGGGLTILGRPELMERGAAEATAQHLIEPRDGEGQEGGRAARERGWKREGVGLEPVSGRAKGVGRRLK